MSDDKTVCLNFWKFVREIFLFNSIKIKIYVYMNCGKNTDNI